MIASTSFVDSELLCCEVASATIAYRKVGTGPPLVLVHGYPLHGLTYRKLVDDFAQTYTCYVPDLPGLGLTRWTEATDFSFSGQAKTLAAFADALGLDSFAMLAHDTGATISRKLALDRPDLVRALALIGTEIPNHRPPWVEAFQKISNPRRVKLLQTLMGQRWFIRSAAAFGDVFDDKNLIDGEFRDLFIRPLAADAVRASGAIRYLLGIDFALVDALAKLHAQISVPVILIWGADDKIFPVAHAREMVPQFADCRGFETIARAKTFVHEERAAEVRAIALKFFREVYSA